MYCPNPIPKKHLPFYKAPLLSIHRSLPPDLVHAIHRLVKSEMLTAIIKAGVNSHSLDAPPEVVGSCLEVGSGCLGILAQLTESENGLDLEPENTGSVLEVMKHPLII